MPRIIAFGCSMTYGDGLEDCYPEQIHPSKFAWPQIIADQLGLECVNKASPGSSNKKICHEIINFKFEPDDLVFVQWSYRERSTFYKSKEEFTNIGHWATDPISVFYNTNYSEYDSNLNNKVYIGYANVFLKQQNIKFYNILLKKTDRDLITTFNHIPLYICDYREKFTRALDGMHPGHESHLEFSRALLKHLNINSSIPKQKKLPLLKRIFK